MTQRAFIILAVVTLVVTVAAVVASLDRREPTSMRVEGEPAFPELVRALNDAAEIVIKRHDGQFTVKRSSSGTWSLAKKSGYPVPFDKVKSALVGLSELKLLEPKTNDPARYDRLEVEDVTVKDAKSRAVTVKDGGGKVLAATVLGKSNANLFGSGKGGTYLRRGDDARVWLAEGEIELGATARDWLNKVIIDVAGKKIRSFVLVQPDGARLTAAKPKQKDEDYSVENIPAGRKLDGAQAANRLATALNKLELEDVKPVAQIAWPKERYRAEYTTYDGLTVKVELAKIQEEKWATFSAKAGPASVPAVAPVPEANNKDDGAKDAKSKPKPKPKDAKTQAKEINDQVNGWAYRLANFDADKITTKISEVLAKPEKERVPESGSRRRRVESPG